MPASLFLLLLQSQYVPLTAELNFYLGVYEVTQGQWEKVMGNNPSYFKKGNNYPVEQVSWEDVQQFIYRLNNQSGRNYRLPTEAEWEYAARSGGITEKYAGTSQEDELKQYAWYAQNSDLQTHPVGQKRPNGLGLYDMIGNVGEWCADWYDENYYKNSPRNNPKGPNSGTYRVLRGNSYLSYYWLVRASTRSKATIYPDPEEWINPGDSVVIEPGGKIVSGPMRNEEGILYAEIDPERVGAARRSLDVVGHYARPDIFQLHVNRKPLKPINFEFE